MAENSMPSIQTIDPVVRALALLAEGTPRVLIALAGFPGSGKSTLAAQIERDVNARAGANSIVAVGMDGFHLSKAELNAMPDPAAAFRRRGAPWTFDAAAFAAHLKRLKLREDSRPVMWPRFEHGHGDPVPDAIAIPSEVRFVLVEGLYVLYQSGDWSEIPGIFDERWFLDTPMPLSLDRLATRHMATRGTSREAAEARIAENDRLNAEIVEATRDHADFLVRLEVPIGHPNSPPAVLEG